MKSELRQDLVSGDWIVISPGRAKRPSHLLKKIKKRKIIGKEKCPFENSKKSGQKEPVLIYGKNSNWKLQIMANKFPAFTHEKKCVPMRKVGPYLVTDTSGHHELLITRDHYKNFDKLDFEDACLVFRALKERYRMFLQDQCISYVSIFQNWGLTAGASIYHPHFQIIATPIIPPDIMHSLRGSMRFYKNKRKCVHCVMIDWERKNKKRIVFENSEAIAVAPFFSKNPYEIRIFPKSHFPYFEDTPDNSINGVVAVLKKALEKIRKNLKDPDYNFFIHTAPIEDKKKYPMYHWHIEIIPKITIDAGFELGTGVEINVVDPDDVAKILKK